MKVNGLVSLFRVPTEIIYGFGSAKKIGEAVRKLTEGPVLVVTDQGVVATGLLEMVLESLREFDLHYEIFADVEANPSVETVEKGLRILKQSACLAIVAVGGGSPLDAGKAIALLAVNGGSIADYEGADKVSLPSLPLVAIPTTAGTASEVTLNIVITDLVRQYKLTIVSARVAASTAILDPVLTRSMPPKLTAATGVDALVHAIESYTSLLAYPVTEPLALESIRLISENLRPAVYNGNNMAARDAMLMGSLLAGLAFSNTRLGNAHAMSHPLSARSGIPHGVANAILIPHVMKFNAPACPIKFARIAAAMGEKIEGLTMREAAIAAVAAVQKLNEDVLIPHKLSDVGVDKDQIAAMAQDAMKSGNVLVNPRQTNVDDILHIYEKAY